MIERTGAYGHEEIVPPCVLGRLPLTPPVSRPDPSLMLLPSSSRVPFRRPGSGQAFCRPLPSSVCSADQRPPRPLLSNSTTCGCVHRDMTLVTGPLPACGRTATSSVLLRLRVEHRCHFYAAHNTGNLKPLRRTSRPLVGSSLNHPVCTSRPPRPFLPMEAAHISRLLCLPATRSSRRQSSPLYIMCQMS